MTGQVLNRQGGSRFEGEEELGWAVDETGLEQLN